MAVVMAGGVYYAFRLQDQVSPALSTMMRNKERARANLEQLNTTVKGVQESTSTLRSGIFTLGRAFVSASIMSFVFHLTQRRLIYAQERVRTATEDLEKAIRKYGEGSVEVERASRRLSLAQTSLAFAQREANLQTFLMVMQLAPLVTRFYQAFTSLMKMNLGVKIGAFFLKNTQESTSRLLFSSVSIIFSMVFILIIESVSRKRIQSVLLSSAS